MPLYVNANQLSQFYIPFASLRRQTGRFSGSDGRVTVKRVKRASYSVTTICIQKKKSVSIVFLVVNNVERIDLFDRKQPMDDD